MSGFPLPELGFEATRGFYEAAARGELAIPRCGGCAAFCWYPRQACPACGAALRWTRVSGRGTLFAWAVVRRPLVPEFANLVPYATGLVALEEDPSVRIVTRIVDCAPELLRVDLPLCAVFRPLRFEGVEGEVVAPLFAPRDPAGARSLGSRR